MKVEFHFEIVLLHSVEIEFHFELYFHIVRK